MTRTFPEMPNWTFEFEEFYPNAYRVVCTHRDGRTITFTEGDYDRALARARQEAIDMDARPLRRT
jgi:hypothetical protein